MGLVRLAFEVGFVGLGFGVGLVRMDFVMGLVVLCLKVGLVRMGFVMGLVEFGFGGWFLGLPFGVGFVVLAFEIRTRRMSRLKLGGGRGGQSLLDEMLGGLGFGVSCGVAWGMVDFECFWMRLGLGLGGGREGQSAAASENSVSEGWEGGTS